jgi:hypothetical protein
LFLLGLDEEEGEIIQSMINIVEPAIAGAVLAELALQGRIEITDHRVQVINPTPTEKPILDRSMFAILDAARLRKLKYWINTLAYEKLLGDIGQDLVENGILVRKKKRLHLVSSVGDNSIGKVSARYWINEHLRQIVLAGQQADLPDKVLLAILYQVGLLKLVFTRSERKAAERRVRKLILDGEGASNLGPLLDEIVAASCQPNH